MTTQAPSNSGKHSLKSENNDFSDHIIYDETVLSRPKQLILIIDDEKINVKILNELLGSEADIIFALNPHDGLKKALDQKPDLILLDVLMPEMDGYAVCSHLKSDPRTAGIPIIFVTAKDNTDDEERGLSIGAIDYISKPFRPVIVRARVKNQLDLHRVQKQMEIMATRDSLTGILNRRHFLTIAESEQSRARRYGRPLCLACFDLDHFKHINDTYGHSAGDAVLLEVTKTVSSALRTEDVFSRMGGEEFALLLPDTDVKGAAKLAERIRQNIGDLVIGHDTHSLRVTASFGVTSLAKDDSIPFEETFKVADQATYIAKEKGRNTVVVLEKPGVVPEKSGRDTGD